MSKSSDTNRWEKVLAELVPSMEQRCNRANLQIGVAYTKCQSVKGVMRYTDVGQFVRSYRMGSGDGMTLHWEFDLDGKIYTENDALWGSITGEELVYYTPTSLAKPAKVNSSPL